MSAGPLITRSEPRIHMRQTISDFFDRTYVINLVERTDRRREMERQFRQIGIALPYEKMAFFPAVRPDSPGAFPSIGARGCFLSHLGILENAQQHGFARILICEDDLNFVPDFQARIGPILAKLAELPWAFFYGGYRTFEPVQTVDEGILGVASDFSIGTTHFVAFQGDAIGEVGQYLRAMLQKPPGDPTGGPMHVDGAYNWFRSQNPQFRTFIATPELGYQRPSKSDIFAGAWYDNLPGVAAAARTIRAVKTRIGQLIR